jgi:sulfate-transporting ATPase
MSDVVQFALLGLGLGALYALASQSLIVVYRGSGVLNFAAGAIGVVGAYLYWEIKVDHGEPAWLAWAAALAACATIGATTHLLVMRKLRRASPLARTVATLGILIVIQSALVLRYGARVTFVPSDLPRNLVHPFGSTITVDRLILVGIAAAMSLALWAFYRYTKFGLATSAVAENQRAAAALALSPDLVAAVNWAIGSALAGTAAILIAPIVELQVNTMTTLVLAALAAALVAGFRSFPVALVAGIALGVGQFELVRYTTQPGLPSSLPFGVIIAWMIVRGQALPLRDYFLQRLPAVGSGRIRPGLLAASVGAAAVVIALASPPWQAAFVTTFAMGLVLLSVVVVTGYAGQLSLAQFALAGVGALVAGRLVAAAGWAFVLALPAGMVATALVGGLFALPAVRTRGINLAIMTFGLGTAIELMVFGDDRLTGGFAGTLVGNPHLFGLDIDAIGHPGRYAIFCLIAFTLVALMVANLRRGRTGRRLLAVRTDERAAVALGISVTGAKVYAFALSAAIAALGGTLLAFSNNVVLYSSQFPNFTSILVVAWSFVGGIGFLSGPILGSTLAPGALGSQLSDVVLSGVTRYIELIGGVIVVLLVLFNQDGVAHDVIARLPRRAPRAPESVAAAVPVRARPKVLAIEHLTVRYGGVVAVDDLSFTVTPGAVVGLVGPNGAGKTSAVDAITGFTPAQAGSVLLDGVELARASPLRRARAGLSRSFQSLALFEDATVLDNLRAAADPHDRLSYVRDLVHPRDPPLPAEVSAAIAEFRLGDVLARHVRDLPYGQRRLLSIARAVATRPSVLLLDEPAAGLDDVERTELAEVVRRLAVDWGLAVLLIEHDMDFVMSVCDHVVVLDFGRKICEGSPEEVRLDPAAVAAYLGETEEKVAAGGAA